MICPKCGFDQPESPECLRCGVIISRYRGPVLGASSRPATLPQTAEPGDAPMMAGPPPPLPPPAAAGTLYGGPPPALAAAGGGTVYGGAMPGPGASTFGQPSRPAFRGTFESGKILSETLSIYFSNFFPFLLLTALALSPMFAALFLVVSAAATQDPNAAITSLGLLLLSGVACWQLATASITYGVFQQMRGADASIGDCLSKGLSSLLSVIGVVFVQTLGILLGLIACIAPGVILALRWTVSIPVAVEERPGVFETLRRSSSLTDGYRGAIFGVLFVINFLTNIVDRILGVAVKEPMITLTISAGVIVLGIGLTATATAVMYYRLRSIKESIDVDQIASVFA